MFRISKDEELTLDLLGEFLDEHKQEVNKRYTPLLNAYMSDHEILHAPKKAAYKPDNRIVVNFPKYIVDTMNGFFIGNPIKTVAKDDAVAEYVEHFEKYNDMDNTNSALSTNCGIFGKCYEMYYADEDTELCAAFLSPIDAFMIYDDSIIQRPLYFVRRYTDRNGVEYGSVSNSVGVRYFTVTGGLRWNDTEGEGEAWKPHNFKGVPAVEYIGNEIRQGLFEPVMSDINAYNKAISEKANDVDYFADAYLKVLGLKIEDEDIKFIRDSRVINLYGDDDISKFVAEFMDKPSNDTAQENLLDRLERHIFQIAMVANISDENFGGSSGTALQYRTLNMSNLMEDKKRRFTSGLNRRYKLIFSHPAAKVPADAWEQLEFIFTPNLPKNLLEESQIAQNLEGVVSRKTQLSTLSIVDNVQEELDAIEEENKEPEESIVDKVMFGKVETPTENTEGVTDEQQGILG
jgi:SPP1 family phage portal protein